ncbi:hypothetical protein [Spirosoma sp. KNUC1025]|uniref:hypothetical protein n=1 Tax=Spirosoma sp. KNUC1025 TaxID=2894082 RepID=UPI00387034D2|nr:hypothetical protein LN737_06990 [Spirosoma sp. KNUC1025]
MTHSDNLELKKWLTDHIDWNTASRPLLLKNFFPYNFDNYLAILWTPGIIDNFPFTEIIFPPDTIEQTNKNIEIWRTFNVLDDIKDDIYTRTTFKEISKKFKIHYDRNIIYKFDYSSRGLTTLFPSTKITLERIIKSLSNDTLNLFVEDYWRWTIVNFLLPVAKDVTYNVTDEEFLKFMDDTFYDASAYFFPDDKSWCLINLEDLNFSILAFDNKHLVTVNNLNIVDSFNISPEDKLFD